MHKSSRPIIDLIRLLLFLIFLPIIILLLGPVLVIAAILGRVSIFGKLQLTPGRYYRWERILAFVLGCLLWLLSWGGLFWAWNANLISNPFPNLLSNQPLVAEATKTPILVITPSAETISFTTLTPTLSANSTTLPTTPIATTPVVTTPAVATPLAATPTNVIVQQATLTPSPISSATTAKQPTATSTNVPTFTPTQVVPTISATSTPIAPLVQTPTPSLPATFTPIVSPLATDTPILATITPTLDEMAKTQQAIDEANSLLLTAIQDPSPDNLAALETRWQQNALNQVKAFIQRINNKYQPPVDVSYIAVNQIEVSMSAENTTLVQIQERWIFQDANNQKEGFSRYSYTLQKQEDRWVIVSYEWVKIN